MTTPPDSPIAFRPVVHVLGVKPGMDPQRYAASVVRAFTPHLSETEVNRRVERMLESAPALDGREATLRAVPPTTAAHLDQLSQLVDATARKVFAAVPDPLVSSAVTVLSAGAANNGESTVAWVRQGRDGELQFTFPRLVVDLSAGTYREVDLVPVKPDRPHRAAPEPMMDALAMPRALAATDGGPSAQTIAEDVTQVASSVSWALPPPWNVGVTAALSVIELFLHATDKPQVSPMDQLKKDLEAYMKESKLTSELEDTRAFNDNLLINTAQFTYAPADLPAQGDPDFESWWHGSAGIDPLDQKLNSAISDLETYTSFDADGAKEQLAGASAILTTWTAGQKIWMQYNAMKVAAQLQAGNVTAYSTGQYADLASGANWRHTFDKIQERLFGLQNPDDPTVTEVEGLATRIATWIQTQRDTRLGKLHAVERTTRSMPFSKATGDGDVETQYEDVWGWRFVDDADGDEWAHWFPDTSESIDTCHSKTVQHQDQAQQAFTDRQTSITTALDDATGEAAKNVAALRDRIHEIAQLMPPAPPKDKPTVTLATSGTATPTSDKIWTNGASVSYQIAFADEKKLGTPGPGTTPVTIGDFAGATLTNIPQDKDADYIHIIRTVRTAPEAQPIVRKLPPVTMGTQQVTDTPKG